VSETRDGCLRVKFHDKVQALIALGKDLGNDYLISPRKIDADAT